MLKLIKECDSQTNGVDQLLFQQATKMKEKNKSKAQEVTLKGGNSKKESEKEREGGS